MASAANYSVIICIHTHSVESCGFVYNIHVQACTLYLYYVYLSSPHQKEDSPLDGDDLQSLQSLYQKITQVMYMYISIVYVCALASVS